MPAAADVAALALHTLLGELGELRADQIDRAEPLDAESSARFAAAMAEAKATLAAAGRLDRLEAATQRLALACMNREIPQPARAAAYAALVALIAGDLLPSPTFRTLYEAWESLHGSAQSAVILRGEEVLFHVE